MAEDTGSKTSSTSTLFQWNIFNEDKVLSITTGVHKRFGISYTWGRERFKLPRQSTPMVFNPRRVIDDETIEFVMD